MARHWGIDDPLYRGDDEAGVRPPQPAGNPSLVRHILQLDGLDKNSPFVSTTDDESSARYFAGERGRVWHTLVKRIESEAMRYVSKAELLELLKGKGKGDAVWPKASQVALARVYVEQWGEHLIDSRKLQGKAPKDVEAAIGRIFKREKS